MNLKDKKYQPINVLPLANRVIIMPINNNVDLLAAIYGAELEQTQGGVYVIGPKDERIFGVIVAVGAELPEEGDVMPSDVVYYNKYAAQQIEIHDRIYVTLRKRDILGRLEKNEVLMLDNRLLVLPDEALKITVAGIIIPDDSVEEPATGTIWGFGPELSPNLAGIEVGDRVLYHKYGGVNIVYKTPEGNKNFLAIPEAEVIALIED